MALRTLSDFVLTASCLIFLSCSNPGEKAIPDASGQMLLVITDSDTATTGNLCRFTRGSDETWQKAGDEIPIILGRSGLAWGKGLHPENLTGLPKKVEGDGKSPAGVFLLSAIFGYPTGEELPELHMPYLHVSELTECIDDIDSKFYNQIVARDQADSVDWQSSEKMREVGEEYFFGVTVDHNTDVTEPGAGSCIFLHIWEGPDDTTSGCTAMSRANLEEILYWLEAARKPVLVQLTGPLYTSLKVKWQLPEIGG